MTAQQPSGRGARKTGADLEKCQEIVQQQVEADHLPLEKAGKTIYRAGTGR